MASPTSASEWKKASQAQPVDLPSGHTALLKRPGMEALFAAGVLPDELTKMALEQVKEAESHGRPQDHKKKGESTHTTIDPKLMEKFLSGENAISDLFESFDRITAMCVVQPTCMFHKRRLIDDAGQQVTDEHGRSLWEDIPLDEREDDVIYTDDVDLDDKSFIFNYVVGGSKDLERFREESGNALADVQPGEDVGVSA